MMDTDSPVLAPLSEAVRSDLGIVCRTNRDVRPTAHIEPHSEDELAEESERVIVCAVCRHRITSEDRRIRVSERHEHRCVNPHGLVFHIGCFREAPGCRTHGVPTTEFTWFRGFSWSFALCGGCSTLLGWRYDASEASFFGLILDRLVAEDERSH